MQPKLKFNPHGAVGIVFIALMFGIAFSLNWNVNWWYFIPSVVLYSGAVIFLTQQEEVTRKISAARLAYQRSFRTEDEKRLALAYIFRWLLGCHLALLFLAVGLLLHFPTYAGGEYLKPEYFMVSVVGGLAIPFLLLESSRNSLYPHGIVALLFIISMFGVAFFYHWSFDWLYWVYFVVAVGLYTFACIVLNPDTSFGNPSSQIRSQLGWHLAFIFLVVGFGLHFKDEISIIGFFIASIAIGLVIPYLLFRGS